MQYGLAGAAIYWLYFAVSESSKRQATLGKRALGLVVVDRNGDPVRFGRATARHLGRIFSMLILGIGYLMVVFTARKQALHDLLAECYVIKRPG